MTKKTNKQKTRTYLSYTRQPRYTKTSVSRVVVTTQELNMKHRIPASTTCQSKNEHKIGRKTKKSDLTHDRVETQTAM